MQEIEIKFQVDPARRAAVGKDVAGPKPAKRQRLQAAYFDTADRALARARIALRVRREDDRWVQTLKGAGDDGMTRFEHNVEVDESAAAMADPARHAGTEVGERLLRLLAGSSSPLSCLYRTDVRRRVRRIQAADGVVELAFDEGRIESGDDSLAVCELEFELVSGSPLAVIETARDWVARHGLRFDTRSKSERGDLLSRGLRIAPPRQAGKVVLDEAMTVAGAERAVLRSCLDQVGPNASQVASGEFEDEHLHQLRVGLRRLRTALRLYRADGESALVRGAAALFRALGLARDRSALGGVESAIAEAMRAAGVGLPAPRLLAGDAAGDDVVGILRAVSAQALLLDLLVAAHGGDEPPAAPADADPSLRRFLRQRLRDQHRGLQDEAGRFDELDDAGRHHLRRRAKRMRYSIEFALALYDRKPVARYLKALRRLQSRLGAATDVAVALAHARERAAGDASAAFAAGWLVARREVLVAACRPAIEDFKDVERFW